MARKWTVRMLGELRAERGDRVVTRFRGKKAGALLARLAFPPLRAHPRERLIDLLWGDETLELANPRQSLSQEIYSLRNQLAEPDLPKARVIQATRDEVWLDPEVFGSDVEAFETALEAADRAGTDLERARRLEQAVRLYRGELMPSAYDEWVLAERYRLAELRLGALRELVTLSEAAGDIAGAIDHATAVVGADPLDEAMHRALIRLHAAAGRPGSAERQFTTLVEILESELGVEPDPETKALIEAVRAGEGVKAVDREAGGTSTEDLPAVDPRVGRDPGAPRRRSGGPSRSDAPPGTGATEGASPATITALVVEVGAAEVDGADLTGDAPIDFESVVREHVGTPRSSAGGWVATFGRASDAVAAALDLAGGAVRMGLATGEVGVERDARGVLEAASWLAIAARPGRIVASAATAALVLRSDHREHLCDRGLWTIEGVARALHLFEIVSREEALDGPPVEGQRAALGRLPARFTRFFGREDERRALTGMLEHPGRRLITLLGPAGVGKTRLGLEVVEGCIEAFGGSVWFAPLADIESGAHIPDLLASTLGITVPPGGDPLDTVVDTLSGRTALVVLDNAEHLVDALAPIVSTLLERVPGLTLFVTSQRRIGLRAEHVVPLAPLPVPDRSGAADASGDAIEALGSNPSVALFADRAREAFPEFRLASRNAAAVAEICRRLDGIPLAIELAASRTAVLTPARLLDHLDDRFSLLVSRHRDGDPRHRALESAIEWTVRMLDEPDRRVFAALSVFRGGFSLEALEAVGFSGTAVRAADGSGRRMVDALDVVSRLVDASLVTVDAGSVERRFRMLDSLRAYAASLLGPEETASLQARHAAWILDLAERAEQRLAGPDQASWLDRLDLERENVRAALDWCLESGETWTGLAIAARVWRYWFLRGSLHEGKRWLDPLVAAAGDPQTACPTLEPSGDGSSDVLMLGLHALGTLEHLLGEHVAAERSLAAGLERARHTGDRRAEARALNNLAMIAQATGDLGLARTRYLDSLAIKREIGDAVETLSTLKNLAGLASIHPDPTLTRQLAEECLEIAAATSDVWHSANAAKQMATVVLNFGDLGLARELLERALACFRAAGDARGEGNTLNYLAEVAVNEADLVRAHARAVESESIYAALDDRGGLAESAIVRGQVAYFAGDVETACGWFERSLALRHPNGEGLVAPIRATWLAKTELRLGRTGVAADRLVTTIEESEQLGAALMVCTALDATAEWAAGNADPTLAMTLIGAVEAARDALACPRLPAFAREIEALLAELGDPENDLNLTGARAAGRAMALAEASALAREALGARDRGSGSASSASAASTRSGSRGAGVAEC